VERGPLPLLWRQHDPADRAQDDLLQGVAEVRHRHLILATARRQQRALVDQVLQIRANHAGGRGGNGVEVHAGGQRHIPGMHAQDLPPPAEIRRRDRHPPVEAAGAQQGLVEDLRPVGGRQDDDALAAGESVNLGEDLVEGLLLLVTSAVRGAAAAGPADGVQLVDEDDRGGDLLGLLEQIAHPAGPDPDDHLDEL